MRRWGYTTLFALLAPCVVAVPVYSQPVPPAPPVPPAQTQPASQLISNPEQVLRDLAADDFATRRTATHALLINHRLTPEDLAPLYARATLPEQRGRLLEIIYHHYIRREQVKMISPDGRGSLGVSLMGLMPGGDPTDPRTRPVIRIAATYPGFPAYTHLEPGDTITAVDGRVLEGDDPMVVQQQFIGVIQSQAIGSSLRMTVDRNGQAVNVSVPLAPFVALTTIYDGGAYILRPNYQIEWDSWRRKYLPTQPSDEPLAIPLPTAPKAAAEEPNMQAENGIILREEAHRHVIVAKPQARPAQQPAQIKRLGVRVHNVEIQRAASQAQPAQPQVHDAQDLQRDVEMLRERVRQNPANPQPAATRPATE